MAAATFLRFCHSIKRWSLYLQPHHSRNTSVAPSVCSAAEMTHRLLRVGHKRRKSFYWALSKDTILGTQSSISDEAQTTHGKELRSPALSPGRVPSWQPTSRCLLCEWTDFSQATQLPLHRGDASLPSKPWSNYRFVNKISDCCYFKPLSFGMTHFITIGTYKNTDQYDPFADTVKVMRKWKF